MRLMTKPRAIEGLADDQRELLEAAGWHEPLHLARAEPEALRDELERANRMLNLVETVPDVAALRGWIREAAAMQGEAEGAPEPAGVAVVEEPEAAAGADPEPNGAPVDYEADPEVCELIDRAPLAIPLPAARLAERGISPQAIAEAPLLSEARGDLELRVGGRRPKREPSKRGGPPVRRAAGVVHVTDYAVGERRRVDALKLRHLDELKGEGKPKAGVANPDAANDLVRTPREATNRGRDPRSRKYVRGLLHDRPGLVRAGAVIVLLLQLAVPLALVAGPLLILSDRGPEGFEWVPAWFLVFPLILPVLGLLYLLVSFRAKCRVCGQRVLAPKHCRKNRKAHHVRGLGYILPLALHALIFRWFYCTFCGTSMRLKE